MQWWNRALSRAEIENSMSSIGGLVPGLVAYYDFDELDANGLVPDRSVNGHRLYLRNGARIANPEIRVPSIADTGPNGSDGLFVRALSLNGGGDYLEVPAAFSLHLQGEMTIEGWIRPENIVAASQGIFYRGHRHWPYIRLRSAKSFTVEPQWSPSSDIDPERPCSATQTKTRDNSIRTGQWQHFAAVVSGRDDLMAIYIDGVLKEERSYLSVDSAVLGAGTGLKIGADFEAADFAGQIDEIRVWNRGLSPIEIERYRRQRLRRGDGEGLLVYYSFDSVDAGRDVADLSKSWSLWFVARGCACRLSARSATRCRRTHSRQGGRSAYSRFASPRFQRPSPCSPGIG